MSAPTSNDIARFWMAIIPMADAVDDPEGFRRLPLDWAARLGISPKSLCEFCRHIQESRANRVRESAEHDGIGEGFDGQGLNFSHDHSDGFIVGHNAGSSFNQTAYRNMLGAAGRVESDPELRQRVLRLERWAWGMFPPASLPPLGSYPDEGVARPTTSPERLA